jgi:hypothetical protein
MFGDEPLPGESLEFLGYNWVPGLRVAD